MDTNYNTKIEIRLSSEGIVKPIISYGIDQVINTITINEPMSLVFDLNLDVGQHSLILQFENKTNDTPDMAVVIESVACEGITLDRFKWAGEYTPNYPEPWASQQLEPLPRVHYSATYLGWNGTWILPFTVPVFTWIHKTENLGWLYI